MQPNSLENLTFASIMPNDLDGFQFVSHKKKNRKPAQLLTPTRGNSAIGYSNFDKETCIRRIEEAKEDILATDFYESVRASLREGLQLLSGHEISEIVCFGLGRFTECMTSRYQFALLLLMRDLYTNRVSAYDPIFTNDERDVLKHFNIDLIQENTEGKYKCIKEVEKATDYNRENNNDLTLLTQVQTECENSAETNNYKHDLPSFPEKCGGCEHECKKHLGESLSCEKNLCDYLKYVNLNDSILLSMEKFEEFLTNDLQSDISHHSTNPHNKPPSTESNCSNPLYDTTLFFLPHCPKQLSNNLLWANWGLDLSRCIIVGNSFNRVLEANTKRVISDNAEYLLKISPYVKELAIINSFKYYDIFNDTAIHIFPRNKLAMVSEDFWEDNKEPVYNIEDVEFVRGTKV